MHDLTLSPDARAACADRTAAHIEALAALVSSESRRIRIRPGVGDGQESGVEAEAAPVLPTTLPIRLEIDSVRTAFRAPRTGQVVASAVPVVVELGAPSSFLYPFAPPEVRVRMRPPAGLAPFLPGLHWVMPDSLEGLLELLLRRRSGPDSPPRPPGTGYGIPCLYRRWLPRYDLVFLFEQIWQALIIGDSSSSVGDAMNEEAARHFARNHALSLPLDRPLGRSEPVDAARPKAPRRFHFEKTGA